MVDSQKSRHRHVTLLQGLWVTWTFISTVHLQQHLSLIALFSLFRSGFGRFTEVKAQTCDTAPRTMSHMDIHINCPSTAKSVSDCFFENKPCSGIYVWIQCEPFINDLSKFPLSLSYTPNSAFSK